MLEKVALISAVVRQGRAGGFAISAILLASAPATAASDLVVRYDQSQLLRLPRPVAEVIIGNPGIADVAVQGGNILVVTGKSYGVTNIIALDGERNVIQDQRILVERDQRSIVNLHRGVSQQTYSCTPNCAPMMNIGDDNEFFGRVSGHTSAKAKAAESSGGDQDR